MLEPSLAGCSSSPAGPQSGKRALMSNLCSFPVQTLGITHHSVRYVVPFPLGLTNDTPITFPSYLLLKDRE